MIKTVTGIVLSNKMEKAVVVQIERRYSHPVYKKVVTTIKKIKARCQLDGISVGDKVTIQETRPISKEIRFEVVSKIEVTAKNK